MLTSCGSKQATADQELQIEPAKRPISEYLDPNREYVMDRVSDPFEGLNRRIYRFNYHFDRFVFLPIVKAYSTILPDFAEKGVSNFFNNVREIKTFYNSALQLQGEATVDTLARFGINTTVGILGVWDPATRWGFERHLEDFGQTLGHYGVGNGPFLVLPLFGPSNLRDTSGLVVDRVAMDAIIYDGILRHKSDNTKDQVKFYGGILNAIDTRHRTAFRYHGTGSPFEYELIKMFYTEMRNMSIQKH
jgi:phospholipid-binding lipoprotein MlaA